MKIYFLQDSSLVLYGAYFGWDKHNFTIYSMSRDQNGFHSILGKCIPKSFLSGTTCNGRVTFGHDV